MPTNSTLRTTPRYRYLKVKHLITGQVHYFDLDDEGNALLWEIFKRVQPTRWEVVAESHTPIGEVEA